MATEHPQPEVRSASPLEYETPAPEKKRPFFTPGGWFLLAGFIALTGFAGCFSTNGRINGRADVWFYIVIAVLAVFALMAGIRSARRPRARG